MPSARELAPADAQALTRLYGDYDWWDDRSVDDVRAALEETAVALGIVDSDGDATADDPELVAAARVLTDYRYYGIVFDVIVAAEHRGEGHGDRLVTAVVEHPDLQSLPGLSLLCRTGLVQFYESIGFEVHDEPVDVPEGGAEDLVRMRYVAEE